MRLENPQEYLALTNIHTGREDMRSHNVGAP